MGRSATAGSAKTGPPLSASSNGPRTLDRSAIQALGQPILLTLALLIASTIWNAGNSTLFLRVTRSISKGSLRFGIQSTLGVIVRWRGVVHRCSSILIAVSDETGPSSNYGTVLPKCESIKC